MTHTPFVSNPCPTTAIVFVSQNLFYGQLPQGRLFLLRLLQSFDLLGVELEEFVVEIKLLLNFVHQVRIGEGL